VQNPNTVVAMVDRKADYEKILRQFNGRNFHGGKVHKKDSEIEELLNYYANECDFRYQEFSNFNISDISTAEQQGLEEAFPRVFIVIDELADVLSGKKDTQVAKSLIKIGQIGRAAGIHLVCATQRPSASLIPTELRSQFVTRVSFRVLSATDSRMALGFSGAEHLTSRGDGLYYHPSLNRAVRFQAPLFVEE
jgi:DNA segregation ATPase FtsK/SpoIIIE-like protein